MANETISEQCETLYNKLNTFVESEISRDVTPQISNLNSRIDALEPNLVRVKEVNGNVSSVSAGGTSTKTFTVPACPSGYNWKYLSTSTGWGTVSSASLNGTTLTVTLLNVSNSSHDISFSGALVYYPKTIEAEPHISVTATNPYLLSGEVTDLVVSLVDEFGLPLGGKTVTISDGTSVYNGITNNNGTYTKTGVSVNNVTCFTATYNGLISNVTLYPCIFRDYAVTGNKSTDWYVRSTDTTYLSVTVDNEGTTLSSNDTSTSRFYFANPEQSTSTSPPITISDFVIECDVVSTTFGSGSQIAFLLQGLTQNFNLSNFTPPYHLKMERIGDTVKMYVDDNWKTTTISSRTNYYMGFQLYKTGSIKFKNYIIYEL